MAVERVAQPDRKVLTSSFCLQDQQWKKPCLRQSHRSTEFSLYEQKQTIEMLAIYGNDYPDYECAFVTPSQECFIAPSLSIVSK
ncbi:hypothetical protein Leryth_015457, partial [Lithospermum erythrorhizon]